MKDLTSFIKHLDKQKGLPPKDKYAMLMDFHSLNAMAFYSDEVLKRAIDWGDKPLMLKDIYPEAKEKDANLTFSNGRDAARGFFRKNAKLVGLGLQYGGGANLIEEKFNIPKSDSIRIFAKFFSKLKVLSHHLSERVEKALQTKYVETLLGGRLYLPQLNDAKQRNAGKRKVYNSPIQGTASNLISLFILKTGDFIERMKMSKYQGNNIAHVVNGKWFNRIVSVQTNETDKLLLDLSKVPNGHTRLLLTDKSGNVISEYNRAVNISFYLFEKYNMELIH